MIRDLGIVRPGTTLYVPFHTFDSNDPSASVTITGLATTDVEIYKDGSVTQRASDNGYALLDTDGIDFDGTTGIHGLSIDLADNTTAGFYAAGSQYWVVIASITVDAATINFLPVTFRIGYPDATINTTIATLSSQTSFTLTTGPAEDDALNGCVVCIHDVASAVQMGFGVISDYTGSTKTVTLLAGTTFTAAATDNIAIFRPSNIEWVHALAITKVPLAPTTAGRDLDVTTTGAAGIDWGNVENPTTTLNLSATNIDVDQIVASVSGAVGSVTTVTSIVNGVLDADMTGHQTQGTLGQAIGDPVADTNTIYKAVVSDATGATVGVDVVAMKVDTAAILVDTAEIGAAGAGLTNIDLPNQTMDIVGNITGNLSGSVGSVTGSVGSVTGLTVAGIVDGVWDEVLSGHTTVGTAGQRIQPIRTGTAQAGAATTITLDASASAVDDFYNNNLVHITAGTGALQARVITDYVGSTKVATVNTWATNPASDSVFQILPGGGATITGTVDANVVSMAANTMTAAAAASDLTTELQTGLATAAALTTVDTVVDAILALLDDARTEPAQGAPPVNPDLATKVDYLYKFLRNRITQTSTTLSVYADNATTVDHKATVSDNGTTYDRGEIVTGP